MIEIERVLRRQHKIARRDNDFQIRNQTDILATLQQTRTRSSTCSPASGVSLFVAASGS